MIYLKLDETSFEINEQKVCIENKGKCYSSEMHVMISDYWLVRVIKFLISFSIY